MRKWGCHSFHDGKFHAIFPMYGCEIADRLEAIWYLLTERGVVGFVYNSRRFASKKLDTMILTGMGDYGIMRGSKWRETHKRECQGYLDGLKVKSYVLAPPMFPGDSLEVTLDRIGQKDGSEKWGIKSGMSYLGKDLKWHPLMTSSDATDEFMENCRFQWVENAVHLWEMFLETDLGKRWKEYELSHISDGCQE